MSTSAPWTLKNECTNPQCQHEKDSHHLGQDNCLVLHCDCARFYKKGEYEALKKATPKPVVEEEEPADTPRMPFGPWGSWP